MARALIIEDEQVRAVLRVALETGGHQVAEAGDGSEAIGALRRAPCDLLFCDLFMPGKEGLETIQELRRELPAVPILALSGSGFRGTLNVLRLAGHLGAAKLLAKPFGRAVALAAVEEALGANARVKPPSTVEIAPLRAYK